MDCFEESSGADSSGIGIVRAWFFIEYRCAGFLCVQRLFMLLTACCHPHILIKQEVYQNRYDALYFSRCPFFPGGSGLGSVPGLSLPQNAAEKEIGSAEQEATRIVNDALKSAESKKREALVEARKKFIKSVAFTNKK